MISSLRMAFNAAAQPCSTMAAASGRGWGVVLASTALLFATGGAVQAQVQCTAPLAATLQSSATATLSIDTPGPTSAAYFVRTSPTNLIVNGDFEAFTNAALRQGGFQATLIGPNAVPGAYLASMTNTTTVPNWTVTGGNATSYPWHALNSTLLGTPVAPLGGAGGYIYLGISAQNLLAGGVPYNAPFTATPQGSIVPPGVVTLGPNTFTNFTGRVPSVPHPTGPVAIEQTVNLQIGRQYRMTYYVAAEALSTRANYTTIDGIMGLDISGYTREYLRVPGYDNALSANGTRGTYYTFEFTAKQVATTIRILSYGHATTSPNVIPLAATTTFATVGYTAEPTIDDVILNPCALNITGNVFNDSNALIDSTVNGTGTNAGSANLRVYLIGSGGTVVASTLVSASGTYTFANVIAANYSVVLSNTTTAVANGQPAPAPSLPAGWTNIGENNSAAAGSDGNANGTSAVFAVGPTSVANINFGIQPSTSLVVTKTNATTSVSAGGTTSYTLTVSNLGPSAANGVVVKDQASSGLVCTALTACTPVSGASCPATLAAGFAALFSPTGYTITNFPANSAITFTISCNVVATGL